MEEHKIDKSEDPNLIAPMAMTTFRNENRTFGIKRDDRRRHIYVIGKTGMGKSTFLENMVYSDVQNGQGICYVDPHGDTAEKMLQWVPQHRVKDVIYFNPADRANPIAFNVLEQVDREYRNLVASGLVSVYKKLWADSWGPRLEYILRYCILALLDAPESTLLGINRMLVDDKYRKFVVSYTEDPVVRAFWEQEFTKWNERVIAEVISPIQNKVGQFLSNTMIRNIVGQLESSFSMREIMDNKKILILNLSKGKMGEDASALLGAMMITKLQLAAMSRVDIPEDDRKDYYLYVDEFQNFATESFANILSEARKYRLNLIIAHQYIAQLEHGDNTAVRDAVFGNVGTIATFRVGAADAEFLEKEFAPQFTMEDLVNLPKYNMYMRLMVDGVSTDPFSAQGLPPLAVRDLGFGDAVVENTRKVYSKPKETVERQINEWAEGDFSKGRSEFHAGSVEENYEKKKAEEGKKKEEGAASAKATASQGKKGKKKKEDKPIVWRGSCDVDGEPLELTFEPSLDRPILCQDHLREFRKGDLSGEQVETLMGRVMERKVSGNKEKKREIKSQGSGNGNQELEKGDDQKKGSIRIVEEFSDEKTRMKNTDRADHTDDSKKEKMRDKDGNKEKKDTKDENGKNDKNGENEKSGKELESSKKEPANRKPRSDARGQLSDVSSDVGKSPMIANRFSYMVDHTVDFEGHPVHTKENPHSRGEKERFEPHKQKDEGKKHVQPGERVEL